MLFYKKTFTVNQNQSAAFEYFSTKNYLKRFSRTSEKEEVEIISENKSPLLIEGEEFEFISMDDEDITTLNFKVLKVKKPEIIIMSFSIGEIIDRQEGTLDDDVEMTDLLKKYFGESIKYIIKLKEWKGKTLVVESSEIEPKGFFPKVLVRIFGFFYKLSQWKSYKKIKKEIETGDYEQY